MSSGSQIVEFDALTEAQRLWDAATQTRDDAGDDVVGLCESLVCAREVGRDL